MCAHGQGCQTLFTRMRIRGNRPLKKKNEGHVLYEVEGNFCNIFLFIFKSF